MSTQWYLCEINHYPEQERTGLKPINNLSTKHPEIFESIGAWCIWLPIIPRVGDTLQFPGYPVQVSRVVLRTDWNSKTGHKERLVVSARISIRDDVIPKDADFSIESSPKDATHEWEDFACRGNDLQYYAWELKHESYVQKMCETGEPSYYRWHTRVRPVAGDIIAVQNKRWCVVSVELASANALVDGWLTLEKSKS